MAGAFAGGAALAVPFVAPELVRRRILTAITERTGMTAELASVELGLDSVGLDGLSVRGDVAGGHDVEASFDRIDVSLDVVTALSGDLAAVREVSIQGGHVHITSSVTGEGEGSPSEATGDEHEEASASGFASVLRGRALPPIEMHDVAIVVSDGEGELLRVGALSGSIDGGSIDGSSIDGSSIDSSPAEATYQLTANDIEVEGGPLWSVAEASVELVHGAEGMKVRRIAVRDASLRLAPDESARQRRLRQVLRRGPHRPERDSDSDEGRGLFARLTTDFTANVEGVAVALDPSDADAAAAPGLRSLEFSLVRVDERLTSVGSGELDGSGQISWDLDMEPAALVATGSIELTGVPLAVLAPFLPHLPFYESEHTAISGRLTLEHADLTGVHASGTLDVVGLGLSHPRIAPEPITGIGLSLRGSASWAPLTRALTIDEIFVRTGAGAGHAGAEARLAGSVVWEAERYALNLIATLPRTACNDAIHAIPSGLLGELSALTMTGTLGGAIELDLDSADLDATRLRVRVANACRFVSVPAFAEPSRFEHPFHHRVEENDGDVFEMDTGPGTLAWTPIQETSPFFLHAVIAHEDASFFVHQGFAPWAIRDALVANLRAGRYVRGASTITMQLVKNAFLHREKTLARKVQEVLLTWWVETAMSKEDILQLYVNLIELGDGIYGVRDAAMHWFGRTPGELSAAESVYLAMILPNPPVLTEEHRLNGRPPEAFRRRMANFLRHLGETGRYDAEAVAAGLLDIEAMRFFHPDEAPPGPRPLVGSTAALPVAFFDGYAADDLSLESSSEPSTSDTEREPGEASWDRWEEVVP